MKKLLFIFLSIFVLFLNVASAEVPIGGGPVSGGMGGSQAGGVETDPIVGAINGIVKSDGAGNVSAAVAGTDYEAHDSTLTDIADGIVNENLDLSPQPLVDAEVNDNQTLASVRLGTPRTSAPTSPLLLEQFLVDNATYDPANISGTDPYIVMLCRDTTELMPNQVDRDFSGASAWANVDFDSYDETGDLTITASAANQYCTLVAASAPTTNGKRYRIEFDVANIVSTLTVKDFDGTNTIGTVTANGTDQYLDFYADDSNGGFRIVAVSSTSSGDFDNFSLNELPWRAMVKQDGSLPFVSDEVPSYTHHAAGQATYNDTSTPHVLTTEECTGGIITNAGATEDKVYTFAPAAHGMNGMGMVIAAYQVDYEPPSGVAFWLNGTQMAANEHIQNTADTKGDTITFWTVETSEGVYEYFFKSDNANFVEETP